MVALVAVSAGGASAAGWSGTQKVGRGGDLEGCRTRTSNVHVVLGNEAL